MGISELQLLKILSELDFSCFLEENGKSLQENIAVFLQKLCEFIQESLPDDLAAEVQQYAVKNLKVVVQKGVWLMLRKAVTTAVEMVGAQPVLTVTCSTGILTIGFSADAVLERIGYDKLDKAIGIVSFIIARGMVGCVFGGPAGIILGGVAGFGAWYLRTFLRDKLGATSSEDSISEPKSSDLEEEPGLLTLASPETPKSFTLNPFISIESPDSTDNLIINAPRVITNAPVKVPIRLTILVKDLPSDPLVPVVLHVPTITFDNPVTAPVDIKIAISANCSQVPPPPVQSKL